MRSRLPFFLVCLVCAFLSSCTQITRDAEKRVGVDDSWFPLQLAGRENNVTAFSTELLKEIGKIEKISFTKITVNWDDLVEGLQKQKYDAILSSIPPYNFNQQIYDFSELYLMSGPVLMVPIDSQIDGLKKLRGREIAVLPGTNGAILLEKYPGVLIRIYDSIPKALNDLLHGNIDGVIVDVLSAVAYCEDLYQRQLKLVTDPLTNEGLRMLTLKKESEDLIRHFNRGMEKLKSSGAYEKLLIKWGLKERCNS